MDQSKTLVLSPESLTNSAAQSQQHIEGSDGTGSVLESGVVLTTGMVVGGKYRLLSSLQERDAGSVFIAHPLDNLSARYVIKVQRCTAHKISVKRFMREAKLHSQIKHGNIVELVDYWSDDYGQFIVLEFIDGQSLKECCAALDFDEEAALIVALEVSSALQYVWENFNMIHRDIKPENIMLNKQNYIKLLDFGIAKTKSATPDTYMTMDNAILGTPGYMSPEQFTNAKNASIQSDMFSLGATIYFLLTKKIAFTGKDLAEIYNNTCKNTPPDIKSLCPSLSDGFVNLLNVMMQPDPANRPASWNEIINYVQFLIDGK